MTDERIEEMLKDFIKRQDIPIIKDALAYINRLKEKVKILEGAKFGDTPCLTCPVPKEVQINADCSTICGAVRAGIDWQVQCQVLVREYKQLVAEKAVSDRALELAVGFYGDYGDEGIDSAIQFWTDKAKQELEKENK